MQIVVLSGPSGAGKSTLVQMLLKRHSDKVKQTVSHTTRKPRVREVKGRHYFFVTRSRFEKLLRADKMLGAAEVHNGFYGTSARQVDYIVDLGFIPILVIDIWGWKEVQQRMKDATAIFVLPPSASDLWRRLRNRRTEDREECWRRFLKARDEINWARFLGYQWFVVNEEEGQETAYEELREIIIEQREGQIGSAEGRMLCDRLLIEFETIDSAEKVDRLS